MMKHFGLSAMRFRSSTLERFTRCASITRRIKLYISLLACLVLTCTQHSAWHLETCILRIHERITHPITADNHFVSDKILRGYYLKDNIDYMISSFKTDYGI